MRGLVCDNAVSKHEPLPVAYPRAESSGKKLRMMTPSPPEACGQAPYDRAMVPTMRGGDSPGFSPRLPRHPPAAPRFGRHQHNTAPQYNDWPEDEQVATKDEKAQHTTAGAQHGMRYPHGLTFDVSQLVLQCALLS